MHAGQSRCCASGASLYGILPVVSLDLYAPASGESIGPRALTTLRTLREWWRRSLPRVPQVKPFSTVESMSQALTNILATQATTEHVQTRLALPGALYGTPQRPGLTSTPATLGQARSTAAMGLLNALGTNGVVPGAAMVLAQAGFHLSEPLAGAGGPDGRLLGPNYISAIRTASFRRLLAEELEAGMGADTVLYLLLRHAMLLAYAEAAYRIQRDAGNLQPGALRDEALIDIHSTGRTPTAFVPGPAEHTRTPLRMVLEAPVPAGHSQPLCDLIHTFGAAQAAGAAILDEMRASLDHLASVPAQRLDALVRETLDLTSHRLDAWVTSLATARLRQLRAARPTGLVLGGYGWVREPLRRSGRHVSSRPTRRERRSPATRSTTRPGIAATSRRLRSRMPRPPRSCGAATAGTVRGPGLGAVRDRPVVRARAAGAVAPRWRTSGSAARCAPGLPLRARAARERPRQGHPAPSGSSRPSPSCTG